MDKGSRSGGNCGGNFPRLEKGKRVVSTCYDLSSMVAAPTQGKTAKLLESSSPNEHPSRSLTEDWTKPDLEPPRIPAVVAHSVPLKVGTQVVVRRASATSLLKVVEVGIGQSDQISGFWVADGADWLWFRLSEHAVRWWHPGEERTDVKQTQSMLAISMAELVGVDDLSCGGSLLRALSKCARKGGDLARRPLSIWCKGPELCALSASCEAMPCSFGRR